MPSWCLKMVSLAPLTEEEMKELDISRQKIFKIIFDLAERQATISENKIDKSKFIFIFLYQMFYVSYSLKEQAMKKIEEILEIDVKEQSAENLVEFIKGTSINFDDNNG